LIVIGNQFFNVYLNQIKMRTLFFSLFIFVLFNSHTQSKKDEFKNLVKERDSLRIELKLLDQSCSATFDSMTFIISDLRNGVENLEKKIKSTEQVIMGEQTWMKYNLDVATFRNGDTILQAQSNEDWEKAGFNQQPAWCYYVTDEDVIEKSYGKLYNLFAVNDPRGLAPEGWHISSETEWRELEAYLLITDYYFEDVFYGNNTAIIDRGGFSEKCLKIGFGGWRDVGCGGLNQDAYYWIQSTVENDETPRVHITAKETKSTEMEYLRNRQEELFIFDSTSWIMGHYVRCVKD
jgi:uncharacterized protein (TIGR02145 family)